MVLLINYLLMRPLFPGLGEPAKVPYTFFKEQVRRDNVEAIDAEVMRIIGECHGEARRLLTGAPPTARRPRPGAVMERETLDEREILEVTGLAPTRPAPGAAAPVTAAPAGAAG